MTAMTNYLEDELLDHMVGTGTWASPTGITLALHSEDPTEVGNVGELGTAGGYAAQALTFAAAAAGACATSIAQTFTASGADFSAVATHITVVAGANVLFHGAMDNSRDVNDGDTLTFAIGAVNVTLD